ncbi:MAG: DNA repair protein RadC [Rhodospirillaceae bacterium]|nr:DNA repair protein RadC [Rhodospirillaceae bacterium]MDE0363781.1 DNA repair protein RadC [Rhodospirillaceae bacterium]
MSASKSSASGDDRFDALTPASLSKAEKDSVVALALAVLKGRNRRGRAIRKPEDIENFLRLKLSGRRNEAFGLIYLDTRHRLIEMSELFNGTVDGASVYPRVVVQKALERNAAALIAYHNHPSGNCEPSEADRKITVKLVDALALVDIRLLDHLVVGNGRAVSMAERGWV